VTAAHVRRDPARDVREALRRLPPFVPEPPIHRDGIAVLEALDDHVEHRVPLSFAVAATRVVAASRVVAARALSGPGRPRPAGAMTAGGGELRPCLASLADFPDLAEDGKVATALKSNPGGVAGLGPRRPRRAYTKQCALPGRASNPRSRRVQWR